MKNKSLEKSIIAAKYKINYLLGQGGIATTYAAENLETKEQVAIKVLSLGNLNNWKNLELFEREAKILAQLNHAAIPQYIDYFQEDTEDTRNFYLVQQLASGKPLSEWIDRKWRPEETEVKELAIQLLEILVYLQQLTPPIIHRDIKPQNIIRQADGTVFLVDFGAVQDVDHHTVTGGSTVVGTFGYMAPEQFRGKASLGTDLYGLGTTLLYLLTRQEPDRLPQKNLKINFRSYVYLEKDFANWLDKIIEPAAEDRLTSAEEALAVLKGEKKLTFLGIKKNQSKKARRGAIASVTKRKSQLIIEIPGAWNYSSSCQFIVSLVTTYNLIWLLIFVIVIKSGLLQIAGFNLLLLGLIPLFCFLLGLGTLVYFYQLAFLNLKIKLDEKFLRVEKSAKLLNYRNLSHKEHINNLKRVRITHIGEPIFKNIWTTCSVETAYIIVHFGLFLSRKEQQWLVTEILNFSDFILLAE
ncbi:Protein kinase domain [Hyella patelloides LEGE 07179]|uniref:non-specific serine/threonine protein kinase n=1 Tax=Hyella patelloides LEGE 07179 TaxID=945734 RepID=A0A563VW47_9CYAN|nr:serine/threonine-protein kinase [Hyella patelloides]VEP15617.1 Protein kinase domain [Hyella patelloides LEGE 07179]